MLLKKLNHLETTTHSQSCLLSLPSSVWHYKSPTAKTLENACLTLCNDLSSTTQGKTKELCKDLSSSKVSTKGGACWSMACHCTVNDQGSLITSIKWSPINTAEFMQQAHRCSCVFSVQVFSQWIRGAWERNLGNCKLQNVATCINHTPVTAGDLHPMSYLHPHLYWCLRLADYRCPLIQRCPCFSAVKLLPPSAAVHKKFDNCGPTRPSWSRAPSTSASFRHKPGPFFLMIIRRSWNVI